MIQPLGSPQGQKPTPAEEVWEAFHTIWRRIRTYIHEEVSEQHILTVSQFVILRGIHKGKDSVSKLADSGQISRPAISRSVDILVNKGFVDRKRDPNDRRYVQLSLTEEGENLMNAHFEDTRQWILSKLDQLNETEMETVLEGLGLLMEVFKKPGIG